MAKKVYLGVGHGGKDPGAVANGFEEADLNLDIAKACKDELVRHGVQVMISREGDITESLSERIKECNTYNPDFAIDIHNNAGGGDGAEVFHSKKDAKDDIFATNILTEIYAIGQNVHSTTPTVIKSGLKTRLNSSGTDYFGFIRQVKCPSNLVECAFVDNKKDIQIIDTLAERKTMGVAIAKGILKSLGIAYKANTPAQSTQASKPAAKTYKKGQAVKLNKTPLYISSTAKKAVSTKTGTYYIYDGIKTNGRYRITNKAANCGKKPTGLYTTGWITR